MKISDEYIRSALAALVSIPSVNPELGAAANPPMDASAMGEAAAADWVAGELADAGLSVERIGHGSGRASVVGTLEGGEPGPTLMLNGHIDTVPPGDMEAPFDPLVRDGRLHGRGAYDMKSGVVACVAAARVLAEAGAPFAGTLQVSAVADEETESKGTQAVLERGVPDAVVVTEPSGLVPCIAHRGFAWLQVRTRGRAAHGSMPDRGRDANRMMGRVLHRIDAMVDALERSKGHPLAGRGSMHVGRLQGGGLWSVYADRCVLGLERRTVPGETGEALLTELDNVLDDLAAADPDFDATAELILERSPFDGSADSRLLAALQDTGRTRGDEVGAVAFWTDAAFFAAAGADVVVLGPDGTGAHADVEWVDVGSVVTLAHILVDAGLDYLAAD